MTLNSYFIFFGWFFLLVFLSFLIGRLWARLLPGYKFRLFIAPGVIVHEFSHALACLFTGAKVTRISLFAPEGGYVEHSRSRLGFLGAAAIAMAPIFGITLLLWLLAYWFGLALDFKTIEFSAGFTGNFQSLFFLRPGYSKERQRRLAFLDFCLSGYFFSCGSGPVKKGFSERFFRLAFYFCPWPGDFLLAGYERVPD